MADLGRLQGGHVAANGVDFRVFRLAIVVHSRCASTTAFGLRDRGQATAPDARVLRLPRRNKTFDRVDRVSSTERMSADRRGGDRLFDGEEAVLHVTGWVAAVRLA